MRHTHRPRLLHAAACLALSACAAEQGGKADSVQTRAAADAPDRSAAGWGGRQIVAPGPDIAWSPKTLVDSAIVDVDQDGSLDRVELYANVERDRRERLMFDDGQRWALIVRAGPHLYQLFEGFIQLGRLDFWVVASTDASPAILPLQQTPNGVLVQKYVFDRQRKAFVSTGAVDAVGTVVHQPVPR